MMHVPLTVKAFPRYFKEAGYTTGFIGKWHIGKEPGPKEHGFDHVYHPGEGKNTVPSETEGGKAEYELTRETIKFIEANKDRPFVAYLGHYTPHIPYMAKPHLIEKNKDAFEPVYAAVIETLDDTIGMITDKLEELNLSDNTIFVFTSDNGGLHVPEGLHKRVTHNTPFRAGKGFTYQGSRPNGAMRDGNWILIEYYDEDRIELYDLQIDVGEHQDVAGKHPDRVASMRASLDAWRREINVQYNTLNPDCDEEKFKRLYVDVDPGKFDPVAAGDEEWARIHEWRAGMDAAIGKIYTKPPW